MATNNNGVAAVEVLAERIANLTKKVDEQAVFAQTAITVALAQQEKTVNAAFAASEKAITKAEESQKEYNKTIGQLQNDVVGLKESRSQATGTKSGIGDVWGYIFGALVALGTAAGAVFMALHK